MQVQVSIVIMGAKMGEVMLSPRSSRKPLTPIFGSHTGVDASLPNEDAERVRESAAGNS